MHTDVELFEMWRDGDASAGEQLFARHVDTLYRFFCTKVSENTDDLVQQTFIACLESHSTFAQRSSFRAFLLGIARFQLYAYYRARRRERSRRVFETVTALDLGPSPITQTSARRRELVLLQALGQLPVNLRIALELSYWEDMTASEMSEVLDIPPDTVYSRLRRARKLLSQKMRHLNDG